MRYINIIDLKDFDCYQNINCRLLYLELCSMMDYQTRDVTVSVRKLERALPLTYAAIRHALEQLKKAGVVAQVTAQEVAQEGAQTTTQRTTHLHIMSFNELQGASNATSNAESNATSNAESNAESNAYSNKGKKNIIIKNSIITLTRAEEILNGLENSKISMYVDISEHRAEFFKREFCARMRVKEKTWSQEGDVISHFLDWSVKNKKSLISRSEQIEMQQNQDQTASSATVPHPKDKTAGEWEWICRTVASGKCAKAVLDEYKKGCHELGIIPTYAM